MSVTAAALRRFRFEIPLLATAVVAIGVAFIHSATFHPDQGLLHGQGATQAKWLLVALGGFAAALAIPYRTIERYTWFFYGAALVPLFGVHLLGHIANGQRSWYRWGGAKFQPSEVVKIALICAVAKTLMYRRDVASWRGFAAVAVVAGPAILSILKEPDLGTVLVFVPAILAMLFVAGAPLRTFALLAGAGAAGALAAYRWVLEGYQRDRILVFLHGIVPDALWVFGKLPSHRGASYQTDHALMAVGGGGFWGTGYEQGVQTQGQTLPEAHTDFIFPVVCEEGGFAAAAVLLALLLALLLVCLDVAQRTREPFGRLCCVGIASLFAGQIFVNCGMTIGLMPVTGITLPLVSYGGSSLLGCFTALGLVANVALRPVASLGGDWGTDAGAGAGAGR